MSEHFGLDRLEVRGVHIAYRRAGQGPPLVLLHGGPSDSREWRHQLADCLVSFMQALGLERPHVIGLSFGSGLALELYRWHSEIPRSLLLASAYAGWAGSLPPEVVEQRKQRMLRLFDGPPEQFAQEFLPTLLTGSAPPALVEEVTTILSEIHPAGQRALFRAGFAEHDLRDVLPRIAVPTLLIYGDRDVRSPKNVAEEMHAQIPGSRLEFIPDVGHQCDMEAPERFNAEVRAFIRSLPTGP